MAYPTDISYIITDPIVGYPPISSHLVATAGGTPAVPSGIQPLSWVGKRVRAVDLGASARGEGEFIYLKFTGASCIAGDVCNYSEKAKSCGKAAAAARGPIVVAMAACATDEFAWFQRSGSAVVNTDVNAVASGAAMFLTATAGIADDAVVATDKIDGMVSKAASSGGFTVCELGTPSANGNG